MDGHLTNQEFMAIFDRSVESARFLPSVDSQELLATVTYFVMRNTSEAA